MNGSGRVDDAALGGDSVKDAPLAVWVLLAVVLMAALGFGVVKIVGALATDADCGSYGYGGYQSYGGNGGYGGYGGYGCKPGRGDATLTVEPATGLVDRQSVRVRGTNYDANTQFGAAECDAKLAGELQNSAGCDLTTVAIGRTAGDGTVSLTMPVRRIIQVQGVEVDCAVAGACVLGGATIPNGFDPTEAASAAIQFDPNVPPIPRLSVEITVDEVTPYVVSGTATCNRAATLNVNAFVHQTRGSNEIVANGYSEDPIPCGPTPGPWSTTLFDSTGRLAGGTVDYTVFGYAYDGFESAQATTSGETRVSPGGPPPVVPADHPGTTVSVSIVGSTGRGAEQTIDLLVTCGRAVDEVYASVVVSQWVGTTRIQGYGSAEVGPCKGATSVSVPLVPANGTLTGGPAEVRAFVSIQDISPTGEFFFDSASAVDAVRLQGRNRPQLTAEPNPHSRITITSATRSTVSGTVACDEPLTVRLYSEAQQENGRTLTSRYGNTQIDCAGVTAFSLRLNDTLSIGAAIVAVYGDASRAVDGGPISDYVWSDHQSAEVRVRH
jgi:hypothetical protein